MTMSIDGAASARVSARAAEKSKALLATATKEAKEATDQRKSTQGDRVESASSKIQSAYDAQGRLIAERAALERLDKAKEAGRKLLEGIEEVTRQAKATRASLANNRKEAAKERIRQIKQQLQTLRAMAAADPKGTAKRVAQLARELASAAKEYSSAGGGAGEGALSGGASTPSAIASAGSGAANATSDKAIEAAKAQAGEAPVSVAAPVSAGQAESADKSDAAAGEDTGEEAAPGKAEAKTATSSSGQSDKAGDQSFKDEVKRLMRELKALYELAKRLAQRRGAREQDFAQTDKDMRQAGFDVEVALSKMASPSAADAGGPTEGEAGEGEGMAEVDGAAEGVAAVDMPPDVSAAVAMPTVSILV
ncbi:hypothetical protein CKO38_01305 [Rhodospirillum rubrum]|uniref:hypothetical protein n=1 Tax=Rhodospirillum rubrum TaxID=1085 RepID=UPI001904893F|nr:hypothetical protein [Rhodospirillum rubrum]MBK1664248.1 hypothetical protein [Rhodospirillum rubrum]MBK1675334.1 hypothetical protein [Rhodospirillum rubrum]